MSESAEQQDVDYSNLIRAQTRQVDIDAFKERGMKRVNVINARKINEMISQAVTNIIGRMEDADLQTIKDDKAQIVMESMDEFKRIFAEQKKEAESQSKLQEELELLRESLAKQSSGEPTTSSTMQAEAISDQIKDLKAFIASQNTKNQREELAREAMLDKQSQMLESHFADLKDHLAGSSTQNVEEATRSALTEAVDKMTALLEQQEKNRNGSASDGVMTALGELRSELDKRFAELTSAIRESGSGLREDLQKASSEGLKSELSSLREELQKSSAAANSAGVDSLKSELTSLREELQKSSAAANSAGAESLKAELAALRADLEQKTVAASNAGADSLKAELAALRADLEQKTVAASAANTEALQAQLNQMQEMLAKGGGGGGGPSGDLNDIVSKLEGSMSRKLAEAGIGKQEVTADDAVAASSVMLGAAFKDMDNIESNISGLDAKKTVDKGGAKKAKGALDALKKLKGKG